jgi:hypothetical protein
LIETLEENAGPLPPKRRRATNSPTWFRVCGRAQYLGFAEDLGLWASGLAHTHLHTHTWSAWQQAVLDMRALLSQSALHTHIHTHTRCVHINTHTSLGARMGKGSGGGGIISDMLGTCWGHVGDMLGTCSGHVRDVLCTSMGKGFGGGILHVVSQPRRVHHPCSCLGFTV